MKIAVSATQPRLDSEVDSRFGRCACFVMIDSETMEWQGIENRDAAMASGAGIGAAQMVASHGAGAVITGVVGPKASQALAAAKIQVFTGAAGTVRQAVEAYKAGQLQSGEQSPTPLNTGMGRGMGRGQGGGRGMGRGMGGGGGRGMGGGGGRGNR